MIWPETKGKHLPIPSVANQQTEKLAEMGAQLWTSRLEQGLSLDEMVILTRIPRRLLQAIEEGDLEALPEPVYTQGLIRQFADALGYNGAEFSRSFPIGLNRVTLTPAWKKGPFGQLRPYHLYLLYVFLIFCSVSSLSQLLNTTSWQANSSPSKQLQTNNQGKQKTQIKINTPKPNSSSPLDAQPVQIGLTLKERSWIRVVADGKIQYEGELPEGTHRIWKAHEQLTIRAGNAGGVLVSVKGQQAKQMGQPGTVKEMTIAANTRS
ncbi:helix-turn-helix domain-containing protein [Iningainema tapete]|uniref:Helix-turn-helix domain-containing protein n=1 Tax=Iningainema tapete BLCC-T55 TaxID=2748662 RepID=A0A8J6XSH4_9CYAN|nr:RodZ domain-containing protein [Iningainema tapete]MBD2772828.1 helix-turn-helix domain-containing protein [Iningainema tapete BLCC-T55]